MKINSIFLIAFPNKILIEKIRLTNLKVNQTYLLIYNK